MRLQIRHDDETGFERAKDFGRAHPAKPVSLDAGTVCVEATETATADQLSGLGFEVIPVPFWDVAPFGGGLHCATADIERDGELEDYFPSRYGRF